ncbi:mycofactocin-coupled SDR family oxidoreductase [Tsukamurella soli]|uniref:Mycofactocin-coupled SDR family oxidoreductase n=1 Tax=Tsukamurella soli TaxID=644556 RepID=A0ABP8JET8_9ACTN
MARLDGKVAFITGVARGQGRAHAVRMAHEGAQIVGVDLTGPLPAAVPYDSATPADLSETARLIAAEGSESLLTRADVRDLEALTAAASDGVARFGGLDVVVANAGICPPQAWNAIEPADFAAVMDTNVTGAWNTVMATAPHLVTRGGGSIILTSSAAGIKMQAFMVHYTTSKHALVGMARGFAAELGQYDIRVNTLHPGPVNTPMGSGDMAGAITRATETNPRLGAMMGGFLNQWIAEPEEIAAVAAFLASDESKFMTAQRIVIDGGNTVF